MLIVFILIGLVGNSRVEEIKGNEFFLEVDFVGFCLFLFSVKVNYGFLELR